MNAKLGAALAIALVGQVLYHVCQKAVAPGVNPIVALVAFYLVAGLASLPLLIAFPIEGGLSKQLSQMNWAIVGVGVAIVLIEIGFLLAYRVGGQLSSVFVLTSASVACALLVIGLVVYRESMSASKVIGIALALAGIFLVSRSR